MTRSRSIVAAGLLGLAAQGRVAAAEAVLHASINDAITGRPTTCTVTITDATGKIVTESDSFKAGFRCSGNFSKRLPAGLARIRITRGFETKAIERQVELSPGQETNLTFALERRVDLRRRGWYAGDSHVHMLHGEKTVPVNFDFVALTAKAEDLQYMSLAQAWNIDQPTPEHLEAELTSRSAPDCLLTWNLEAPKNYYKGDAGRCLGHCWNLGMRGRTRNGQDVIALLLNASAWDYESEKPSFANFESHQLIHAQGGVAFYSHPARWWMGSWGGKGAYPKKEQMRVSNMAVELPLDTLLGPTYDGLDIITGPGEFEANAQAFEIWKLLLNHGYRLAATGSSDACFDRPGGGIPGAPRTYTYVPGAFSISKAARATAAGRTFVTTGPLLIATLDGSPPGTSFDAGTGKHQLRIEAWAGGSDIEGLKRLEILRNGNRFQELLIPPGTDQFQTNVGFVEDQTAWYCTRAFGSDAQRQVAVSGAFFFADKTYRAPQAAHADIRARILDARSGKLIPCTLTEVTFMGTIGRDGKRHSVPSGRGHLSVRGTVRLRAEAKGFQPLTLSPFFDSPELVKTVTELAETDLLNWKTFERIRKELEQVDLVFQLRPQTEVP